MEPRTQLPRLRLYEAPEGAGARSPAAAAGAVGPEAREGHPEGRRIGKVMRPRGVEQYRWTPRKAP